MKWNPYSSIHWACLRCGALPRSTPTRVAGASILTSLRYQDSSLPVNNRAMQSKSELMSTLSGPSRCRVALIKNVGNKLKRPLDGQVRQRAVQPQCCVCGSHAHRLHQLENALCVLLEAQPILLPSRICGCLSLISVYQASRRNRCCPSTTC